MTCRCRTSATSSKPWIEYIYIAASIIFQRYLARKKTCTFASRNMKGNRYHLRPDEATSTPIPTRPFLRSILSHQSPATTQPTQHASGYEGSSICLPKVSFDLDSISQQCIGDYSLTFIDNGKPVTIGNLDIRGPSEGSSTIAYEIEYEMHPDSPKNRKLLQPCSPRSPTMSTPHHRLGSAFDSCIRQLPRSLDSSPATPSTRAREQKEIRPNSIDPLLLHSSATDNISELIETKPSNSRPRASDTEALYIGIIAMNLDRWRVPLFPELRNLSRDLRFLLLRMGHSQIRTHVARLLQMSEPQRRKCFPYIMHVVPEGKWPIGVPYRDPAHVSSHQKLALLAWGYINPEHSELKSRDFLRQNYPRDSGDSEKLWQLIVSVRDELSKMMSANESMDSMPDTDDYVMKRIEN